MAGVREAAGVLKRQDDRWVIELENTTLEPNFDATQVKLLFWPSSMPEPTVQEEIATMQQLELATVQEGLLVQGALATSASGFLDRLRHSAERQSIED